MPDGCLCVCGQTPPEGQEVMDEDHRFRALNQLVKQRWGRTVDFVQDRMWPPPGADLCQCGCGQTPKTSGASFLPGHNRLAMEKILEEQYHGSLTLFYERNS